MGRIILTFLIAVGLAGAVGWYFELFHWTSSTPTHDASAQDAVDPLSLGEPLFEPAPDADRRDYYQARDKPGEPIVMSGVLDSVDKVDIGSAVGGEILYIGDGVPEGVTQIAGVAAFVNDNYRSAWVTQGGRMTAKFYKPLGKNSVIYGGQMIGEIDYSRALNNYLTKSAKYVSKQEEYQVSLEIDKVANERLEIEIKLGGGVGGRGNAKEIADAKLTKIRTRQEVTKAFGELQEMELELDSAKILLDYHAIRPKRPFKTGYIKVVYKDTGEAVKELENVLNIYSVDRLRADAFVESHYFDRLKDDDKLLATIEPVDDQHPQRVFLGHRANSPINGVAFVSVGQFQFLVSAGEDGFVKVWHEKFKSELRGWSVREAVKALACSSREAKQTLCAAGTADGKVHLWNLVNDKKDPTPRPVLVTAKPIEAHRDAVTALAFSPDGAYFASGAADGAITLWEVAKLLDPADGKPLYVFDHAHGVENPHQGAITSLTFTPQCRLISASRDNSLRVWSLKNGAHLEGEKESDRFEKYPPIDRRSGNVSQLGVSADGRWMLFDQGKTLQLMATPKGEVINTLKNPGGAIPFETLAIFSPDSAFILTAGAPEGRLQLWRAPIKTKGDTEEFSRAFEVRQFTTDEHSPATCATFAPLGQNGETQFAASGTKDGFVYLWAMPSRDQAAKQRIANVPVRVRGRSVDPGSRQLSLSVEIDNPGNLIPGRPVTIVID